MAYYDENGKITIDENAAASDIRKINDAIEKLSASVKAVDNIISHIASSQGLTAQAILNKAQEMKKSLESMISRLEESASFIRKTVNHYQQVDREVKAMIQAAKTGGQN